jgi:RNA polymerase sigma-70 factor (ECF subfamily)
MDPDLELLQRWREGDKGAGGRLLTKYFGDLHSYFSARIPELDQEDLIQDVFIRMVQARDRFEGRSSFRTYLLRIAQNVFREALRKRYRPTGRFDPLSESVADVSGRTQSSILAENEELQLLLDALRMIPSAQQDLLELHYFHDMTYEQLGDMLDIPAGTAKSRTFAARRALLAHYSKLLGKNRTEQDIDRNLATVRTSVRLARRR